MVPLAEFFTQYSIPVFFLYGLAFFCLGFAILLEVGHASDSDFAYALKPLAAFGLLHGIHEWIEMFLLLRIDSLASFEVFWSTSLRILLLGASFMMLVAFGARLIAGRARKQIQWILLLFLFLIWIFGLVLVLRVQPTDPLRMLSADVYTRYSLAIPGAALAAWGLVLQRRRFIKMEMPGFGRDVLFAAVAFALYGFIGQLFASSSLIFPSEYFNQDVFKSFFGIPIQVLRAALAALIAVFIIRSLRAFEVENRRRLELLRNAEFKQRRRLEDTRAELLHRTVIAQENERKRIARELHDEIGQVLTALGLGLRGLTKGIETKPGQAVEQASQLEDLAVSGLEELQRLVSGLRPPQLDDLGLLAALRWCASEVSEHYQVPIEVVGTENKVQLPSEIRVVLFRIAQEAVTNAIRHGQPNKITIHLAVEKQQVRLTVEDDGSGFDVDTTLQQSIAREFWGLLGMVERAKLVGGKLDISSTIGKGTILSARVPLQEKNKHA